jgi:hypothetical protein
MRHVPDPRHPDADVDPAWSAIPALIVIAVIGLGALGAWIAASPPPDTADGGTRPTEVEMPVGA